MSNNSFQDFKNRNKQEDDLEFDPEDILSSQKKPVVFTNFFNEDEGLFVNKQQDVIGDESWEILKKSDIELFQKGGVIVSPFFEENNQVRLVEYCADKMVGLLSQQIIFVKLKLSKGAIIPDIIPVPHKSYATYILKNCDHSELPACYICVNHPVVIKTVKDKLYSYKISENTGIQPQGVYINPRDNIEIDIFEDIKEADTILEDVFQDFPYASNSSLANSIGQIISGVMRFAMGTEMPPIALTTSQTHGAGKTLETDVIHAILYGKPANWSSRINSLDEYRKTLLTHAISGDAMVCFDNLNEKLNIEALASVATSRRLSGRILHTMSNVSVANYMHIVINGTAMDISTEIADRTIWKVMSIDEKAQDREFKYPAIIDDKVIPERNKILSAIFTYIQNWIDKGSPLSEEKSKQHRAKVWASIIGGILQDTKWYEDFLANTAEQRIQADSTYVRWAHTLREIALHIKVEPGKTETIPFGISEIMPICSYFDYQLDKTTLKKKVYDRDNETEIEKEPFYGYNMLGEDIGTESKNDKSRSTKLGVIFRDKSKNEGTPYGDWKIIDAGQYRKVRRFALKWISKDNLPEEYSVLYKDDELSETQDFSQYEIKL